MSNTKETEAEILRRCPPPPVVMKPPKAKKPSPQQLVDDFIAKAKSARDKAVAAEIQRLREPQGRMVQEEVALDAVMTVLESGQFDVEPDGALCGLIVFDDESPIMDRATYMTKIRALSDAELTDWLAEVAASGLDEAPNECPWCGNAEFGDEPDWDEEHTSDCEALRAHNALPGAPSWDNDDDHDLADAAEIARLRAEVGAINDALGVIDASVASAVIRELRGHVDELLTANNRYLEDARAARRELRDAKAINALITRQLITLREALEFYADEKPYQGKGVVEGGGVVTGELPPIVEEGGAIAEQALQDVFGYQRPVDPPDPYQHNPGARPMPHPGAK